MTVRTIHASAVLAGGAGILILGPSGSGKSALALDLIDHCHLRGVPASLIGDDQIALTLKDGKPFASPASNLAGLIEVRGSGIHAVDHVPEARLHLAVRLAAIQDTERMPPEDPVEAVPGVFLPLLTLPQGHPALRAVLAHLGLYGGVKGLIK
jgi:serine kinase of HPr protein (carbohydrate metabolism regulator)